MPEEQTNIIKQLFFILTPYWKSNKKHEAWGLLLIVILFLIVSAANDAFKTYIPKWLVNALVAHNSPLFYQFVLLGAVMLAISVPITALTFYFFDKLAVSWRRWFNLNLLERYFNNKAYYNLGLYSDIDNPDQRLASDLNDFTQASVQLLGKIGYSIVTLVTFTGILWIISPWLVLTLILYAIFGNVVIVILMRILVKVNFLNLRYQADYRYNLIHVRDNIESIAFYKGEKHESSILIRSFHTLIENYFRLIRTKRNIMFASQAYILFGVMLPYLVLAPRILLGQAHIGLLVQAIAVFAVMLTDLSIIIEQFPELSTYGANIQRLAKFVAGLKIQPPDTAHLVDYRLGGEFDFQNVTVKTPDLKKNLVENLDLTIKTGDKLIIRGPSGCGKSSLLRTVAGLWQMGQGEITTPNMREVMFLPQRPYMLVGSLREQLIYPNLKMKISEEELNHALAEVNLADLPDRVGGLDVVLKWADLLSLGEQQRVMFVRLFLNNPKYVVLDESTSALDEKNEALVYNKLKQSGISYISVGHRSSILQFHDHVLLLNSDHSWRVMPVASV